MIYYTIDVQPFVTVDRSLPEATYSFWASNGVTYLVQTATQYGTWDLWQEVAGDDWLVTLSMPWFADENRFFRLAWQTVNNPPTSP